MYPKSCALFEHEYDVDLSNAEWKKIADEVEQCLRNFYGSEVFAVMKDLSQEKWLEVENFSYFYLVPVEKSLILVLSASKKQDAPKPMLHLIIFYGQPVKRSPFRHNLQTLLPKR